MTNLTEVLIVIGIAIILFFIFRGINLWYWRVNDLIKKQESHEKLLIEQNNLLKDIYIQLGGKNEGVTQLRKKVETSSVDEDDLEKIENLKKTMKNDEIIVRVKLNGRIEKWKKEDWDDIIKIGNENKFDLIFKNNN